MKKFLIVLSIILLGVIGYLLYTVNQINNKLLVSETGDSETGDYETIISQLENELSIKTKELSGLQSEYQLLKNTLSGTMELLNSLQVEKSGAQKNLSGCEKKLEKYLEYIEKLVEQNSSNVSNNSTSNSNTTIINGKEYGRITQVYTDKNGNKKIEIIYGGNMTAGDECGDPNIPGCYINKNPKTGIFTVSDNVQIIMDTLSHTSEGYYNDGQVITFDYFEQKFNDTNNYEEYPINYSNHFKNLLYVITFENNVVVKIDEEYMP